ncbi:MAG TPA: septum formation initiator family protein [Candidatus Solibacter sp.]|nr:septum formation initiator family protein [Candidatus Solibacter sp.]
MRETLPKSIQPGIDWLYRARRKVATCSVVVLACLMAWHVVFGANGVMIYEQKRREQRELNQQIESLRKQNDFLDQQIKALKNDPQAIEKEAREKLRYARPGEVVYTLPAAKPVVPVNQKK